MKISIVYWSGTGNTKKMAEFLAECIGNLGGIADIIQAEFVTVSALMEADGLALGSPAMGSEVIEESYMEPLVAELERNDLSGKPLVLFGSYDWGDGEWMRDWEQRMIKAGAELVTPGVIAHEAPDGEALKTLREAAEKLVSACPS